MPNVDMWTDAACCQMMVAVALCRMLTDGGLHGRGRLSTHDENHDDDDDNSLGIGNNGGHK